MSVRRLGGVLPTCKRACYWDIISFFTKKLLTSAPSVHTFSYQVIMYIIYTRHYKFRNNSFAGACHLQKSPRKVLKSPMKNPWTFESSKVSYTFYGVICPSVINVKKLILFRARKTVLTFSV